MHLRYQIHSTVEQQKFILDFPNLQFRYEIAFAVVRSLIFEIGFDDREHGFRDRNHGVTGMPMEAVIGKSFSIHPQCRGVMELLHHLSD